MKSTTERIDHINKNMLEEMARQGIHDTPENRYHMLTGMRESWMEEVLVNDEHDRYLIAISIEISRQQYKMNFPTHK